MKDDITPEMLRRLLNYDPETGVLTWRERTPEMFRSGKQTAEWICRRWNRMYAGRPAGTYDKQGYVVVVIKNRSFKAHRVIWAITHNKWPEYHIDHIDHNPKNNTLCNLRVVSHIENHKNQRKRLTNTSGTTGVSWDNRLKKWVGYLTHERKRHHLGVFEDLEAVIAARKTAEDKYGFHKNHGTQT